MELKKKIFFIFGLVTFIFSIFVIKLFSLQVVSNYNYIMSSTKNLQSTRKIYPLRGEILDRNGTKLATNKPVFKLTYNKTQNLNNDMKELFLLSQLLHIDFTNFKNKYEDCKIGESLTIHENATNEQINKILPNLHLLPNVRWASSYIRYYPFKEKFYHTIGRLGPIDQEELLKLASKGYESGDMIGKIGIEKEYDEYLKGIKGKLIIKTNAKGEIINEEIIEKSIPGNSIVLSIDSYLQDVGYDLIKDYKGSIVIQDIKSGEILSLVSTPSVDPNKFIKGISTTEFNKLLNDPNNPFLCRPINAPYPASSIFKIVVALGLLNEELMPLSKKFYCSGSIQLGDREFGCTHNHGWENIVEAIQDSCNVFFYNAGSLLGIKNIEKYSRMVGLGKLTGIDIPNEKKGTVPSPSWKLENMNEPWFDGDTYNTSIGQGFTLVTVLQINMLTALIGNKGYNYKPHFLKQIKNSKTNQIISSYEKEIYTQLDIPKEKWNIIHKAMSLVVEKGTAWYNGTTYNVKIAGKTGTAQNSNGEDHSWFTAFGPIENPQIAITVMLENAGYGSSHAAPVVATLFDLIFGNDTYEDTIKKIQRARYQKYLEMKKKGYSNDH